jgi:hypothetical protein
MARKMGQDRRGILLGDQTFDSGIQVHMEEDIQGETGYVVESWEVVEGGVVEVVAGSGFLDETVDVELR